MTKLAETTDMTESEERAITVPSRIPYPALVHKAFGIDRGTWKALVEAVFPNAQSADSVILALSYCRGRKLDVMKRVVHIVPIWSRDKKCMVDTIWPGIGELRTTAFRTGEYAGRDPSVYGPDIKATVGKAQMSYPEWAQVTVYRMVKGQRCPFPGPRVYWLETYATRARDDDSPNDMWGNRPRGQIDKCAEAASLRAGFPEEIGSDYIPEEIRSTGAPSRIVESREVVPMPRAIGDPIVAGLPDTQLSEEEAERILREKSAPRDSTSSAEPAIEDHDDGAQGGGEADESQETPPSTLPADAHTSDKFIRAAVNQIRGNSGTLNASWKLFVAHYTPSSWIALTNERRQELYTQLMTGEIKLDEFDESRLK